MNITGVIAEYNPFHNGHRFHLEESRLATSADYIIAVMSGDFVQRGAPAIINKYERTRMALRCGADLVIELPVAYATASAEYFAFGGISLLHDLGAVTDLTFGVETPPSHNSAETILETLKSCTGILLDEPFAYQKALRQALKDGMSFPNARHQALREALREQHTPSAAADLISTPNNILALEYLKALRARESGIRPHGIPRKGKAYHDPGMNVTAGKDDIAFVSATGIRAALQKDFFPLRELSDAVPKEVLEILLNSWKNNFPVREKMFSALLHYRLLTLRGESYAKKLSSDGNLVESGEPFSVFADVSPSLSDRILRNLSSFTDMNEFTEFLKTRNYTRTRVTRCLTHILLGIRKASFLQVKNGEFPVPYARILGFRREAAPLLSVLKKTSRIPLITKVADFDTVLSKRYGDKYANDARWLFSEDLLAADIYETAVSNYFGTNSVNEYTHGIIIL